MSLHDKTVAEARRNQAAREQGYREKSLKMYPHVCGRCSREFAYPNLHLLTVHHRDHNHDNNPEDGSNWELLCVYCHDEEHSKQLNSSLHLPVKNQYLLLQVKPLQVWRIC